MKNAYIEWGMDYEMVKYEYENQVEAYEWLKKIKIKILKRLYEPVVNGEIITKW